MRTGVCRRIKNRPLLRLTRRGHQRPGGAALMNMGVSNVSVLKGGWKAWEAQDNPTDTKSMQ
jgi:rhodanese-related sulfurtransferase